MRRDSVHGWILGIDSYVRKIIQVTGHLLGGSPVTTSIILPDAPAPLATTETVDPRFFASFLAQYSTEKSRQTMKEAAARLAAILSYPHPDLVPWHRLRFEHTQAVRARLLASKYARVTVNKAISCLRCLLLHAWRLGLLSRDDAERAADLKPVQGEDIPAGRHVPFGELAALWQAAAESPRDLALLGLLRLGLRRNEVVNLDLSGYADGRIRFRAKGNKEREVDVPESLRATFAAWLEVRGDEPGPFLLPLQSRSKKPIPRRMTPVALRLAVLRLEQRAKIRHLTPHDVRRSSIGDLLDADVDLVTVAKIVGHANVNQTAKYDRRPAAKRKAALEKLYFPTVEKK